MNTWRDIKEAPLNQAVFATDGDVVFFGRFAMTADGKCMFEGQDIEEACNYGIESACLIGWQPVPNAWKNPNPEEITFSIGDKNNAEFKRFIKNLSHNHCVIVNGQKEKSTDEMFRALGFSKQTDAWGDLFYLHESGFRMVAFSRETFCAKVLLPSGWETVGMTKAETVACAQLIREMEADNG